MRNFFEMRLHKNIYRSMHPTEYISKKKVTVIVKVPIAANCKNVCLQNTSESHSYHLKIWRLLRLYG